MGLTSDGGHRDELSAATVHHSAARYRAGDGRLWLSGHRIRASEM